MLWRCKISAGKKQVKRTASEEVVRLWWSYIWSHAGDTLMTDGHYDWRTNWMGACLCGCVTNFRIHWPEWWDLDGHCRDWGRWGMRLGGWRRGRGAQDLLGHMIMSGSPNVTVCHVQVSGIQQLFVWLKQIPFLAFTLQRSALYTKGMKSVMTSLWLGTSP